MTLSDRMVVAISGCGTVNPVMRLVQTSLAGETNGGAERGPKTGMQRHCEEWSPKESYNGSAKQSRRLVAS